MDFDSPKTRWKPKAKSNKGKKSGGSCRCPSCRITGPSRGAAKNQLNRTLEQEYHFPVRTRARPDASAIVNWFFDDDNDEEEQEREEEHVEVKTDVGDNESLATALGVEDYEALLREHMEVENALKQAHVEANVQDSAVNAPLMTRQHSNVTSVTEGWEMVSEAGIEAEDWEQVAVE